MSWQNTTLETLHPNLNQIRHPWDSQKTHCNEISSFIDCSRIQVRFLLSGSRFLKTLSTASYHSMKQESGVTVLYVHEDHIPDIIHSVQTLFFYYLRVYIYWSLRASLHVSYVISKNEFPIRDFLYLFHSITI